MKNFKNVLLVAAAASLLTACGTDTPASSSEKPLEPGASVYGGVVIDYANSDANMLACSVFGDFSGGFIYTPKVNTKIQIVPSFGGKNTLSHAEINGTKVEPKIGDANFTVDTYMGKLSLEGVPYIEYTMTEAVPNVKIFAKAAEGTTHKVTLNITDKTSVVEKYDTEAAKWGNVTGSNIDSYFGKAGTHTVEVLEGSAAGFLIQGADLDNYHGNLFDYTAKSEEALVAWNTLEASIDNTMKTAAIFKMPAKDVTVNINMFDKYTLGTAYGLVHGAGYVGKATATLTKNYKGKVTVNAVTLDEYCLPQYATIADTTGYDATDFVTGRVDSHGIKTQNWYKTIKFGNYTLTAKLGAHPTGKETGNDWLYYEAEGITGDWTANAEAIKAWATAVETDAITAVVKAGNKTLGNAEYNKEVNGYGTTTSFSWEANRNATVAAVQDYGYEACLAATQKEGDKHFVIVDDEGNEVVTGATWVDFNRVKEGYVSYVQLMGNAIEAAKAAIAK